jgi:F-type H+-transporting ATPase subunit alpha
MPVELQVCIIYAGVNGFLDRIAVADVTKYEEGLTSELQASGQGILDAVRKEGALSEGTEKQLRELLERYTQAFAA